jgi:ATP-dependent protease ClpP protease subunit
MATTEDVPLHFLFMVLGSDYSIEPGVEQLIAEALSPLLGAPPPGEIHLVIDSLGGSLDSAYKIAKGIRRHCTDFTVVIPRNAKSAATLIALAADTIVMGPWSEMGPLDMQIEHPTSGGRTVSALDVKHTVRDVMAIGQGVANITSLWARNEVGLSRADAVRVSLEYAAAFCQPLLAQVDPVTYSQYTRQMETAKKYAVELRRLVNRPDASEFSVEEAEAEVECCTQLLEGYPTHGYAIDVDEALRLGLEVASPEVYPFWKACCAVVEATRTVLQKNSHDGLIKLASLGELEDFTHERVLAAESLAWVPPEGAPTGTGASEGPDESRSASCADRQILSGPSGEGAERK